MARSSSVVLLAGLLLVARSVVADDDGAVLARQALSAQDATAHAARTELRARGPRGLAALYQVHGGEIAAARDAGIPSAEQRRLLDALDSVAGQRHAAWSGLYWYTDIERARGEARATGRPILSLRLLGRLDEELSCANSRFFRVLLYANAEVSEALRRRFVLHWQSVRPAPRLTVDFGDGRTLVRTVTGNSIHYVLDGDGRVIDALPGLYSPQAFLQGLGAAEDAARRAAAAPPAERESSLRAYHLLRARALGQQAQREGLRADAAAGPQPSARVAAGVALTKRAVERPLIAALSAAALPEASDDAAWAGLAAKHVAGVQLDARSTALVWRGLPAGSERRAFERLRESIAVDSLRNELLLHAQIHAWLGQRNDRDVAALNERVYAELFLTPSSDPWLGLAPDDAYAALERSEARP